MEKTLAKESIHKLEILTDKLNKMKNDRVLYIYEYFKELRNEIDLKAEEDKKAIEDQREEMINRLKTFEKECIEKANEIDLSEYKSNEEEQEKNILEVIQDKFIDLNERIKQFLLNVNLTVNKIKKLEKEEKKLRKILLQNKSCLFKPSKPSNIGDLFIYSNASIYFIFVLVLKVYLVIISLFRNHLNFFYQLLCQFLCLN